MIADVIVVGAGGHAKVCIELLRAQGENVAFCVGSADSLDQCLGVPVLRGDEHLAILKSRGYEKIFIAIGSNKVRAYLADVATKLGYTLVNALSPSAIISPSAKLGTGVAIMAGAVVNAEAVIGNLAIINTGATVDHDCQIGSATHIAPQCALAGNVCVGDQSFLGVGSKIIPGINIGKHVIVGAGSVVISNIDPGLTVVGVPAKPITKF